MWLPFSLLAALSFGLRGILYHWTSQKPIDRNLMLFGVFTTGTLVCLSISLFRAEPWTPGVLVGVLMGMFSFLANASMYKGFAVGKASLVALLISLPSVVVVLLAFLIWGELPSLPQWFAFAGIVCGVLLVRYSNEISLKNLNGAQWALLAMLLFSFNDLTNKTATLLGAAMYPTLALAFLTGALSFCGWWLLAGRSSRNTAASRHAPPTAGAPWSGGRTYLWGMVVGLTNTFGMIFIFQGFKYGVTGLVSAVVSVNTIVILLYARLFLKEKFTPMEFAGLCLTLLGVFALSLMQ